MSEITNDYEPYNAIVEPAISDISDSVPLPVKVGASSYKWNKIVASSQSINDVRFDVNVNPGHLIQREMYISGTIELDFKVDKVSTSTGPAFLFGETDAVRPFFFNQMINQATITIGNNSINLAQRDVFDGLLKCTSKKFLSRWNSQTASYIDNSFKNYSEAKGINNPIQGFEDSVSSAIFNGAYPIEITNVQQYTAANAAISDSNKDSLSAWGAAPAAAAYVTGKIKLKVNEPLFISPFIYNGDWDQNKAAIYGINSFNIMLNLTGNPYHMFCRSSLENTLTYSNLTLKDFKINFITMTPQINQILPIKSVYPIKKVDKFLSDYGVSTVDKNTPADIYSPNINLGSIPDYLVIYVRRKRTTQTLHDASSAFMPINFLNITLNNKDNLLSSLNNVDLWKLSVKNGSTQSFYEFCGSARVASATGSSNVNTVGSLIILSTTDLNLESPLTPGTLANVVLNVRCNFTNNETSPIVPELVVMPISNGIMTIANGNVTLTNSLFYEAGNANVLSNASVPIHQDLAYSTRKGGNLSSLIASRLVKAQGKGGGGIRSAGAAGNSSLFY